MTGSIKGLLVARTYMEQGDGISSGRLATGDTRTILGYLPKLGMRSLAYLILFICLSWRTSAQEFTAEGQLEYTVHNPKGAVSFQLHKYFSIKRNGSKWLIRTSNLFTNEDVNNINIYQEAGSDGTNIFWVSVEDTNRIPKDISASVVGTVTEGIVPITDFSLASSVWLAYASLPYFKGVKRRPSETGGICFG